MYSNDLMIQQTQRLELDILNEFQRICKKYHFTYYAIGGTCIGAIRHNGFIPWDDDIDVAMPSNDYFKFIEVCKTELSSKYQIMNPLNVHHSAEQYIKLFNAETTYIEDFAMPYKDRYIGVFIDIFPIFGMPESKNIRFIKQNDIYNKLNYLLRFPLKSEIGIKSFIIGKILKILFAKDYAKILKWQFEHLKQFPFGISEKILFCWRQIPGSKGSGTYQNIFFFEDFKTGVEVPFEDMAISIPIGFDRYLSMDFGDYMKLPPIEQRVPGHTASIIDHDNSYREYQRKIQ